MEHLPDWTAAAGFCHYMLVARERGGERRVRQWCFSPLDEEADTVWPWELTGPSPLLLASSASSPALSGLASSSSSTSSSSLGSSPTAAAASLYSRSASMASLTSVASFSSFGGGGGGFSGGEDSFSVAGDSDDSSSPAARRTSAPAIRRVRKQRRHRNPVPGAVREEDLDAVPASATLVGFASGGLSLEAVGALAAAVAGAKPPSVEGRESAPPPPPLYELCVNDCRHFVDDLAASVCGARRAVREASRAHWRQAREATARRGEGVDAAGDDEGGGVRGGEVVVAVTASSAVPFQTVSVEQQPLSFSPLREQKQQQEEAELAEQKRREEEREERQQQQRRKTEQHQQRQRRPSSLLHRGAGDAALRAAQLLTDVDHWPFVANAAKVVAVGALKAAVTRPVAALLPCAALSLVIPADARPAAGAAAFAVLKAPLDVAVGVFRAGRAAAGASLRAATARLGRRGQKGSFESPSEGHRNHAIPGLR